MSDAIHVEVLWANSDTREKEWVLGTLHAVQHPNRPQTGPTPVLWAPLDPDAAGGCWPCHWAHLRLEETRLVQHENQLSKQNDRQLELFPLWGAKEQLG